MSFAFFLVLCRSSFSTSSTTTSQNIFSPRRAFMQLRSLFFFFGCERIEEKTQTLCAYCKSMNVDGFFHMVQQAAPTDYILYTHICHKKNLELVRTNKLIEILRGRRSCAPSRHIHFSVSITSSLSTTLYFHLLQRNGMERRPAKCITLCLKWFVFWRCHAQEASKWQKKERQLHGYSICQLITKYDISQVPTKSYNSEDAWDQLLEMEKNVHFICLQFNRIYSQKEIPIWFRSGRFSHALRKIREKNMLMFEHQCSLDGTTVVECSFIDFQCPVRRKNYMQFICSSFPWNQVNFSLCAFYYLKSRERLLKGQRTCTLCCN